MRGARATPRHVLASSTPLAALLGAPPNYLLVPQRISMWGNDVHGDCVTAEEAFAKACYQPEIFISDQEVMNWATRHGVLEGAYLNQVLDWMRNDGFHQDSKIYDDGSSLTVDWTRSDILASAISQGPVKLGIAADQLATVWSQNHGRSGWFATGFHADANEDHCVSLCGYGTIAWLAQQLNVGVPAGVDGSRPGYALFTWNSIGIIDAPSMVAITHEAWLRRPTTVIQQDSAWRHFQLAGTGSASASGKVAAVSRIPGSMELWWVAGNGSVQAAYWYEGGQWQRYQLAPAGSASPSGGITATSRIPSSMEVWWIAPNGSVQDAYWYEGGQWQRFELAPAGSASPQSGIKAVHRIPTSMELWWIAPNGSVQDAYWYEGARWQRFQLAPPGSASPTSGIGAVSRVRNSMELWWVGPNGSVQDAYWYEGGQWQRFELAPAGSASPTSGIGAVSRISNSMELWWVGPNGSVQDAYWYEGGRWQRFELAPAGSASPAGGIGAVSRVPNSMELWWTGANGSVQDAYWYEGGQWQRFELAPAGSASPVGGIAAVSRIPGSMELWWAGPNGSIEDAYWYAVAAKPATQAAGAASDRIEITLTNGTVVRVGVEVDEAALHRVLAALNGTPSANVPVDVG